MWSVGGEGSLKMLLCQGDKEKNVESPILIILDGSFHRSQVEVLHTCAAQYLAESTRGYSAILWILSLCHSLPSVTLP